MNLLFRKVLIIHTPTPLAVRTGRVVGHCSLGRSLRVKLDHHVGEVYCWPVEVEPDTLPHWLPVWLRIQIVLFNRWRNAS